MEDHSLFGKFLNTGTANIAIYTANALCVASLFQMRNLGLCTVGPFGFDLGTLLASYMSLYHIHMLTTENNDAHRRVAYKMMDACKDTGMCLIGYFTS